MTAFGCSLKTSFKFRSANHVQNRYSTIEGGCLRQFCTHAQGDNRSLSNFIETSALRYIAEHEFVDEFEMAEIENNKDLQAGIKSALMDAKARKG